MALASVIGSAALGFAVGGAAGALSAAAAGPPLSKSWSRKFDRQSRGLQASAATLGLSVLADSLVEHYRGSFENPGMYAPLLASSATLAAGVEGASSQRPWLRREARRISYATAVITGLIGAAFHARNVIARPGGASWLNLFYGAPPGAPAALSVAGLFGLAAERLGQPGASREARLLGLPPGRAVAALCSAAFSGASLEAWLLHFRGAFQNPFMWLPVTVGPVAASLMAEAAICGNARGVTRVWLALTGLMGVIGTGFHIYGVSRAMGGWRNWSQNVVDGPPLSAPPSFSAVSLAALAALSLNGRGADADSRHALS